MNTLRFVCQRNVHQIRQFHKCLSMQIEAAAATSSATSSMPQESESVSTENQLPISSKVEGIADQIVTLNLVEVAQLSDLLKKRLNLPDAPMMPMGGFVAAAQKVEEEAEPAVMQTSFTVKLIKFDEKQKVPLIKEMKTVLQDCNLVQAKKFVESAPAIVKANIPKDEAEQLRDAIEKVGGTVEIV